MDILSVYVCLDKSVTLFVALKDVIFVFLSFPEMADALVR